MKLSRKLSRIMIIVFAGGLIVFLIGGVFIKLFIVKAIFVFAGIIVMLIGIMLRFKLRCPDCGNIVVYPQWSKNGTVHCVRCGKAIEYDE